VPQTADAVETQLVVLAGVLQEALVDGVKWETRRSSKSSILADHRT
jgi:hypothetical protein